MSEIDKDEGITTCPKCGNEIYTSVDTCPNCGTRVSDALEGEIKERSLILAALVSLFIPGLGQIYNGQTKKGIGFFVVALLVVAPIVYSFYRSSFSIIILYLSMFYLIFWIFNVHDARSTARDINKGL